MKKLFIVFLTLVLGFTGTWLFKSKTPKTRPDTFSDSDLVADAWWEQSDNTITADSEYVLTGVEPDYIPVPGEKDLFMIVDDDGNIEKYMKRTKEDDGSYSWSVVDPNIPSSYVKVEGLDNVYKETTDGKTKYYKYIRNDDDTYAFIEVNSKGKVIDKDIQDDSDGSIPSNYKRISGTNIYAVYNSNGVIIAYKERKLDNSGKYYWVDAEKPTTTSSQSKSSNTTGYNNGQSTNLNSELQQSTTATVNSNSSNSNNTNSNSKSNSSKSSSTSNSSKLVTNQSDGTYTNTETHNTYKIKDGYKYTYKTTTTTTYNSNGEKTSEKTEGPTLVSKEKVSDSSSSSNTSSSKSKVKKTVNAELARVSVGISFNDGLAKKALTYINNMRKKSNLPSLTMSSSNNAYKLAKIKAADMAKNNHCKMDSPTYGTIYDMCTYYNISSNASEGEFKLSSTNADTIANRIVNACSSTLSNQYSNVGIGIVNKNGYNYICVVLM